MYLWEDVRLRKPLHDRGLYSKMGGHGGAEQSRAVIWQLPELTLVAVRSAQWDEARARGDRGFSIVHV